MQKLFSTFLVIALAHGAWASWYWPFGGSDKEEKKAPPRLSELMEPASIAIDEASDLVADGKTAEAVAEYRKALEILDQIEMEHPDRAATPEFASLRNKRAYISAAIDSILLAEARENAKAVAITDTTELEKRFAERRARKTGGETPELEEVHVDHWGNVATGAVEKAAAKQSAKKAAAKAAVAAEGQSGKLSLSERKAMLKEVAAKMEAEELEEADDILDDLLAVNPNDLTALNLKAAIKMQQGKTDDARKALDAALHAHPKDYHAYFNMAQLIIDTGGNKAAARRYYDIGRRVGGPDDADLEEALK